MSLIDTREIGKVKIMMVGGGGGSDAATLAGIGKKVSVSGKTVTTDIDLFRAPREGDRLLVFFDSLVDDPDTMIVYNDGAPVSISLVGGIIPFEYYLNGICVFELKTNFITSNPYWDLIERSEDVTYTAGTGIGISNNIIRNILPQLGDNSQLKSVDSVTQGRLGSYSGNVKYLLIHFDTDAEPYNGVYSLVLAYSGSVAIMKYATLYDRVLGMPYSNKIYAETTLLCEVTTDGTGTEADPIHVDVLGVIDGYVTAGWGRQAALGDRATAEGMGTEASGNYAHAQGYQTTASGNQSTAMGYNTTASADGATAMGNGTTASGVNSIAGGYNTTASGAVSTAIGTNTQATQQAQVATGKYNKTNNDALVMVGNGTGASARSNALEVLLNGDVVAGNDIIDGQGNTLSVLAEALTKTASGNPVTITDCAGGKARSLKTTIEAIQDLHGYDKPWVGGAYKNLLPMTVSGIKAANTDGTWSGNAYTYRGVTFTLIDDGDDNLTSIVANGNLTGGSVFLYLTGADLISHLLPEGTFILSDAVNTSAITSGSIYVSVEERLNGGNINYPANTNNSGRTSSAFTIDYSQYNEFRALIYAPNGTAINNAVFKPMIRLSTELDATFAPWENICPISGRTAVAVDDTGVNIWNEQWEIGGIDQTTGQNNSATNCIRCVGYINVAPTQSIYLKFPTGSSKRMVVHWYDQNKNYISPRSIYNNTIAVTVPSNAYYMRFYMTDEYGTTYGNNISVNYPSTFTDYVPYDHSSATIQLGTTVYGADINWVTGVATVDHVLNTYDGSEDESWEMHGTGSASAYAVRMSIPDKGFDSGDPNCFANYLEPVKSSQTWGNYNAFISSNGTNVICGIKGVSTSVEAWKTYLASNPLQVCYKLATPTTIQLTPEQLDLLKGYNRVSIEDGSIELGYIAKLT